MTDQQQYIVSPTSAPGDRATLDELVAIVDAMPGAGVRQVTDRYLVVDADENAVAALRTRCGNAFRIESNAQLGY